MNYIEPTLLIEDQPEYHKPRFRFILALCAALLAIGILVAVRMAALAPTFDGNVDVYALQENPDGYDLSTADGAAAVIVDKNLAETNAKNVCFSVVFNFRGYDTMGESFILIASLAGSLCILRSGKKKKKPAAPAPVTTVPKRKALGVIVRYGANLFLPLACVFGGYVILHGDSSPGGGFQGGVLVASAVLLVFIGYGSQKLSTTFHDSFLHSTEAVAEIMYIAIGLIGVLVGLNFAVNFVIDTFHIETAVLMNGAVGYHVMAGVGCLLIMMLGMMTTTDDEPETGETSDEDTEAAQ